MDETADAEGTERVPLAEFDRVVAALERFAGDVAVEDGCARASMGSATLELCRDGRVAGAMPLHEFEGGVETVVFDHDAGELRVEGDGVDYTFRRP